MYEQLEKTYHSSENKIHQPIVARKSVLLPGTPPEIAYAPSRQMTFERSNQVSYPNAVTTEVRKHTEVKESSQSVRRTVTMEQTSRVMTLGDNPMLDDENVLLPKFSVAPSKFVRGQFKESDYDSDNDLAKIRPRWSPMGNHGDDPRYKKVEAPRHTYYSTTKEYHESGTTFNSPSFENPLNDTNKRIYPDNHRTYESRTLPVRKSFTVNQDKARSDHLYEGSFEDAANSKKSLDVIMPFYSSFLRY